MDLISISSRMPTTTTVLLFLYVNLLVNSGVAIFTMPANVTVPALIAFGDSMVDQGNNNYIPTFIRANFPPYGMGFLGAKATGRFTNAKTPVDLIAEKLLVKEYVPPYLDPFIQVQDMITGVSFASAATGFDPLTSTIYMAVPMVEQLQMFTNYIRKLKVLVGKERTKNILNNSLFLVASGSDDFVLNYFSPYSMRKLEYDIPAYADFLVSKASSFVQMLHSLGAQKIVVLSLPPIGCIPTSRTFGGGGKSRSCSIIYNEAAMHINKKLSAEFDSLRLKDPPMKVIFADIYNPVMDMINNPQSYGFEIVDRGCCGTGMVESSWMCNELEHTCSDISTYLFWDSFHPTEKGYRIIVENVLERYVQDALKLWT